ncbi:hypothetical protein COT77_01430 [Candidatus Berkelbacteria bacterium CG10_big_fil_rev_8_21_14_0_10_41_12]|uniref:Uncharacterized protein n=1 Tax=Candidatus Berkelbacteria bacterium CG10_big_fil_rev_8_21_14_0_10_41_12 TaxID=1974513 RepID=A0A2M6WXC5_9BACT|nr:MAG: hypothetical protein COT77_01430 [Candidatus Berkelbacteria bacterium CG10_big_fil_rev_8_21_14_0_10_41_12]
MPEGFKPIPEGALEWKEPRQLEETKFEVSEQKRVQAEEEIKPGQEILYFEDTSIEVPNIPWMPSHEGPEIRVRTSGERNLLAPDLVDNPNLMRRHLAAIGEQAVVATKTAESYGIDAPIKSQEWHNAPWFNLNLNSHLGGVPFQELISQVYIRERRLQSGTEISSSPYWSTPIPVDAPLAPTDRRPYSQERVEEIKDEVKSEFDDSGAEAESTLGAKLFFNPETGRSAFETNYDFEVSDSVNLLWEADAFMVFTGKNDALVSREDGMHLILISKYEQLAHKGEAERFSLFWQDPKMMAEMSIITAAIANIVAHYGLNGEKYDKAYIHMNANWSLSNALPPEERIAELEFGTIGTEVDEKGNPLRRKWPENLEGERGLNVHPHIQILKEGHDLNLPPSARNAGETVQKRPSLTQEQVQELRELLDKELTPLLMGMSGRSIKEVLLER